MSDFRGGVTDYISETFKLEDEILKDIIKQQSSASGPMMNIGPDQGKLIELLIKIHKPQRVLEIGSYFGYSAVWLARALKSNLVKAGENKEIEDCEQSRDGRVAERTSSRQYPLLTCLEKSSKQIDIIKTNLEKAQLNSIAEVLEGDALDFLKKQAVDSFDLIFIDADKASYPHYFTFAEKILRSGGLLLVDNVLGLYNSEVLDLANNDPRILAIRKFNEMLAGSDAFDSTILSIQSGLAIAVKK
ncbi:MAG: O-methyltransferase [Cyanobacteria bacterium REEB446]|nr:O-methyltransferase [Cyanobacteria bacterium REEB446]